MLACVWRQLLDSVWFGRAALRCAVVGVLSMTGVHFVQPLLQPILCVLPLLCCFLSQPFHTHPPPTKQSMMGLLVNTIPTIIPVLSFLAYLLLMRQPLSAAQVRGDIWVTVLAHTS